jgi:hypothetical protein
VEELRARNVKNSDRVSTHHRQNFAVTRQVHGHNITALSTSQRALRSAAARVHDVELVVAVIGTGLDQCLAVGAETPQLHRADDILAFHAPRQFARI